MKKTLLAIATLALCACQTTGSTIALDTDPARLADRRTCADLAAEINAVDNLINKNGSSPTEKLAKDTAVSAAKTGVSTSGVLGSAGAYAGIGVNFITGLYSINAAEREARALENAYIRRDILHEAFEIKQCAVP